MSRPRIFATIGGAGRDSAEFVGALRRAGIDAVRINSAHADPAGLAALICRVREVDPAIGVLVDTKGPEYRTTGSAPAGCEFDLPEGTLVEVVADPEGLCRPGVICVGVSGFTAGFRPGDTLLLDDGAIELTVESKGPADTLQCRVRRGGRLGERKTVAAPGVKLPELPAVSARDRLSIAAAVEAGADMIAHSFVRSEADVEAVRHELHGAPVQLFAKIECRPAIDRAEQIVRAADGVLLARGDLGTQIAPELIPCVEWSVARMCAALGRPMILATQILDSMMERPAPSRAELTDIHTAVGLGIGSLMLTGETARGRYPVEAVEWLRRTADTAARFFADLNQKP